MLVVAAVVAAAVVAAAVVGGEAAAVIRYDKMTQLIPLTFSLSLSLSLSLSFFPFLPPSPLFAQSVGITKVVMVFLSWLNAQLAALAVGEVVIIFYVIGLTMFLLPPVPGSVRRVMSA